MDWVKKRWKNSRTRSGTTAVTTEPAKIAPKSTPCSPAKWAITADATFLAGSGAMSNGHR